MSTEMKLSADFLTFYHKIVGPFLASLVPVVITCLDLKGRGSAPLFDWALFLIPAFYVWWSLPIKTVMLSDAGFVVSGVWGSDIIARDKLKAVVVSKSNRISNVMLYFRGKDRNERKIRIILPLEFGNARLNEVGDLCSKIAAENQNKATGEHG